MLNKENMFTCKHTLRQHINKWKEHKTKEDERRKETLG